MTEIDTSAEQATTAPPRITREMLNAAAVPPSVIQVFNEVFPEGVVPTAVALLPYTELLPVADAIGFLLHGEHRQTALAAVDAAATAAQTTYRLALVRAFVDGWAAQHGSAPAEPQEAAAASPGEPVKLTADFLRSKGACPEGVRSFEDRFPDGVVPTREAVGDAIYALDLSWAISELLEHGVVRERAFDAHNEAAEVYRTTGRAAYAAYQSAPAGGERDAAYHAATNAARRTLKEAQADIFAAAWLEQHPTPAA